MPRYAHAVLGGTFDRLHLGHTALLGAAFAAGRRVSIGLTSDSFVKTLSKPGRRTIQPYSVRRRGLRRWLTAHYPRRAWRIVPLSDRFGRSVERGVGVLVVSAETSRGGRDVNAERRRRGLDPVPVVIVPLVLADDLSPVSSRRIRAGVIDRRGRRRAPVSVGLATSDSADLLPAARAVRASFPSATIRRLHPGPGPRAGGATALAARAIGGRELAVGVARRPAGGWTAVERSATVTLDPCAIPGRSGAELARGLSRLLRPSRPQPL